MLLAITTIRKESTEGDTDTVYGGRRKKEEGRQIGDTSVGEK